MIALLVASAADPLEIRPQRVRFEEEVERIVVTVVTVKLLQFTLVLAALIALGNDAMLLAVFRQELARGSAGTAQCPILLGILVVFPPLFAPLGTVLGPILKTLAKLRRTEPGVSSVSSEFLLAL